jgi:hypothetical protein
MTGIRKIPLILLLAGLASVALNGVTVARLYGSPVYVGAKFCRTCHSSADDNRYHEWLRSAHGTAFESLKGAEKTNPECLSCHTTGYGRGMSEKSTVKDLRGVQCEACHGPGSDYRSMKAMKDPALAREKGLWEVSRDVCLGCHM